jgi:hypothetical protein
MSRAKVNKVLTHASRQTAGEKFFRNSRNLQGDELQSQQERAVLDKAQLIA